MDIDKTKEMLRNFEEVPILDVPEPTFLELRGSAHLENLSSNTLAFFFDTNGVHGLRNLLLKSLAECLTDEKIYFTSNTVDIQTEVQTKEKSRIDLLIETDNYIIAIENKVWHTLINPLADYNNYMEENYTDKIKVKIVLSINQVEQREIKATKMKEYKFVNILHKDFYQKVRNNIGDYIVGSNQKYFNYLIDYIQSMENHTNQMEMNKDMLVFFNNNEKSITNLLSEKAKIDKFIFDKIKRIQKYFLEQNYDKEVRFWIYQKNYLVADIEYKGYKTAINILFGLDEISISLFVRNQSWAPSKTSEELRGLNFEQYKDRLQGIGGFKTEFNENVLHFQLKGSVTIMSEDNTVCSVVDDLIKKVLSSDLFFEFLVSKNIEK